MRTFSPVLVRLIAAISLPAVVTAQTPVPPTKRLVTPTATFPEEFSVVSGVRELSDGRVIASDSRDRTLRLLDWRTGQTVAIGREGAGPGEWASVGRLHVMPGDSTLMSDFRNGRYLIVLPDGKPGPNFRIPESSPVYFGSLLGVDGRGRLVFERARVDASAPMAGSVGTIDVIRYDRATGAHDTLAQRAEPRGEHSGARQLPGGMLQSFTNLPFAPSDAAAQVPLGALAVVRADPYRIDWVRADGRRVAGAVVPTTPIRINQAEKEAFVRAQVRPGNIVVSGNAAASAAPAGSGARSVPQFRGNVEDLFSPDMRWPEVKPPFIGSAAVGAPDGRVWVLRTRAHTDSTPSYDVFGDDGRVLMRVELMPRSRVVGFGRGVVYVAWSDADDLQHLQRHPMP